MSGYFVRGVIGQNKFIQPELILILMLIAILLLFNIINIKYQYIFHFKLIINNSYKLIINNTYSYQQQYNDYLQL